MSFLGGFSGGILGMIVHSGPVAKAVMLVLLFFSVVSWAIIFFKIRQFNAMDREGERISSVIGEIESLKKLLAAMRSFRGSPYYRLALIAYEAQSKGFRENPGHTKEFTLDVEKRLKIGVEEETERLQNYLSFLATTANTAPFVGLFGTVWGIMDSFREIGIRGSTSLSVVAPGISEALIATAFGLLTAIPAVVAYNYLVIRSRRISNRLERFSTYLTTLA
ncbi:MAG: MotA/TolQ/ExbB proton channel family protein [Desulfobacterota bacterium]|nr:MotA/TolQ/ExbB proton channel family protein [Thermodesulfobacteriota bacterium]MDW8001077.1 MotA/TolQ/ExbB proton channel family protein [Deltaproteobacteria bacterium]